MKVIEIANGPGAAFAGLTLAELGCDVVRVEPPGGDPWRRRAAETEDDLSFDYLNRRKRSMTLDITRDKGRRLFLRLSRKADAVVEDLGPGRLDELRLSLRALRRGHPGLVLASISGWGAQGPWRDWKASELTLQAAGGVMANTGFADAAPTKLGGNVAHHIAGLNAATAILASVYGVRSGLEPGVHIDISAQETFTPHWARHISQYAYAGMTQRRQPRGDGRQGIPDHMMAEDGLIYMMARGEWEAFALFLGLEPRTVHHS